MIRYVALSDTSATLKENNVILQSNNNNLATKLYNVENKLVQYISENETLTINTHEQLIAEGDLDDSNFISLQSFINVLGQFYLDTLELVLSDNEF